MKRPDVLSMTGFGRGCARVGGRPLAVEIYTVNHRTLLVKFRLPEPLARLEQALREQIAKALERGTVTVCVDWSAVVSGAAAYDVSTETLTAYVRKLRKVQKDLGLSAPLVLTDLATLPGVLRAPRAMDPEALERAAWSAFRKALAELARARRAEGRTLAGALEKGISRLEALVASIEKEQPAALRRAAERFKTRVAELLAGSDANPGDLAREAALAAERADTAEEILRIRSHCRQLRTHLARGGRIGRHLEFLCQELVRETNTLASKTQAVEIFPAALAAKGEVEKLREQAANVE